MTGKRGRPAFEPTKKQREQVRTWAGFGSSQEQIATMLKVSLSTVKKHFQTDYDEGILEANTVVVGSLFQNCKMGNVAAQIFWCKTRLGWREKADVVASEDNAPPKITMVRSADPARLQIVKDKTGTE